MEPNLLRIKVPGCKTTKELVSGLVLWNLINFNLLLYLLEWKHLICAEFCTDTHTWLLCTAILVIGLMSDEICSWFSIWSVALFITLMVPCTEHHSFPFTFNSFDIGLVAEPSRTICGDDVFHAPPEMKINIRWIHLLIGKCLKIAQNCLKDVLNVNKNKAKPRYLLEKIVKTYSSLLNKWRVRHWPKIQIHDCPNIWKKLKKNM